MILPDNIVRINEYIKYLNYTTIPQAEMLENNKEAHIVWELNYKTVKEVIQVYKKELEILTVKCIRKLVRTKNDGIL